MPKKADRRAKTDEKPDETMSRIDFRIRTDHKLLLERAATYAGQTVTGFAMSTLVERATDVVSQHETLRLSNRDRDRFLELLDDMSEPTPALLRAARRHRELIGDLSD